MKILLPIQDVGLTKIGKIILFSIFSIFIILFLLIMLVNLEAGIGLFILIFTPPTIFLFRYRKGQKKIKKIIYNDPFFKEHHLITFGRFALLSLSKDKIYLLVYNRLIKTATGREKIYLNQEDVYINDRIQNFPVSKEIINIGGINFELTEIPFNNIKNIEFRKINKKYYSFRDGLTIETNMNESVFMPTEFGLEFKETYSKLISEL
jgi:hypothetical protein